MTSVYCTGNAPGIGSGAFQGVSATLYYVAGTTGWTNSFGGLVTRAPLSGLALSAGTLSPSFAGETTSYTASVPNTVTTITVTPTVADLTATVKVNDTPDESGTASGAIALNVGSNTITTVVTAQDGTTTSTYIVTVTRISAMTSWLVAHGFDSGTDLLSSPQHDGMSLMLDYALNLDPSVSQSGRMPQAVIAAGQLSLTYYAGNTDVTCSVETSTDLQNWTNTGVTTSAPDLNGKRTASIPAASGSHFLRLRVEK